MPLGFDLLVTRGGRPRWRSPREKSFTRLPGAVGRPRACER